MVVSACIAVPRWPAFTTAAGCGTQRMRLQNPIADIDDVDVLFKDDVTGKGAVIDPIA